MTLRARARRILTLVAIILTFIILAGATYQGVSTAIERREYPRRGGLIDVGGHQLHIYCAGDGAPVVVLEAPALGTSAAWGWIEPSLTAHTRVCTYDRAGLGWSEASDGPYNPRRVPEELHALLEGIDESGPIVLAGQGLGAAFARMYAARFPAGTAALVLIDPPAAGEELDAGVTRLVRASPWLARTGFLRASRLLSDEAAGLPDASRGAMRAFLNRPDHLTRAARELAHWDEIVALAAASRIDRAVHVRVVNVAGPDRLALLANQTQAQEVTAAITDVIAAVRN